MYDGRDVVLGNLDCLIEFPISVCIVYIHLEITNVASPCVQMSIFLLDKDTVIMILLRLTFCWLLERTLLSFQMCDKFLLELKFDSALEADMADQEVKAFDDSSLLNPAFRLSLLLIGPGS